MPNKPRTILLTRHNNNLNFSFVYNFNNNKFLIFCLKISVRIFLNVLIQRRIYHLDLPSFIIETNHDVHIQDKSYKWLQAIVSKSIKDADEILYAILPCIHICESDFLSGYRWSHKNLQKGIATSFHFDLPRKI